MWFATNEGMVSYDGEVWSRIPSPEVIGGDWWEVVALAAGSTPDGREHVAVATAQGLICTWNGTDWLVTGPDETLKGTTSMAFHRGRNHVATPTGLRSIDPATGDIDVHELDDESAGAVLGVTGSRDGDALWIIGED